MRIQAKTLMRTRMGSRTDIHLLASRWTHHSPKEEATPGADLLPGLDLSTQDIVATDVLWDFFAGHPQP
jgi:hypothetical protein